MAVNFRESDRGRLVYWRRPNFDIVSNQLVVVAIRMMMMVKAGFFMRKVDIQYSWEGLFIVGSGLTNIVAKP